MGSIDAKNSKCWTCKHGLCVGEVNFMSHHSHPESGDTPFDDNEFDKDEDDESIVEHLIPNTNIKGLCFFREMHPLLVGFVEECSRHESKS